MIEKEVIDKLEAWARGGREAPHKVHLYPTNRCNLRCPFCYQQLNPYDYSDVVSKERWLELTKNLCEMGVDVIRISGGGEPLLVKGKTIPMMETVKNHGVTGRMTTNGTLFDEEDVERIVKMEWDHMVFSLDGPDAATHDFHRGREGTFKKVVENIEKFKGAKERRGEDRPKLEFGTALTTKNWKKVPEIIDLASALGVEVITFEPLFVSNPKVKELKLSQEERRKFVDKAKEWKEIGKEKGIFTNIDTVIDVGEVEKTGELKDEILDRAGEEERASENDFLELPCYEPWLWPKVEANGQVGPCSTNLLDVNIKSKSFEDIWFGIEFQEFRELIKEGDLPSGCENCVSTHIPLNERIRKRLKSAIKRGP
ncbi:MAG: radical SAM protein [Candidatus Aenigmatarchaeota archaeon]